MTSPQPNHRSFAPIRPTGPRLNLSNAHLLTEAGIAQIAAGAGVLMVDLTEIEFVDSSGIGALVGLRKRVPDGQVSLINVGGFVAMVLKKTKTAPLFLIDDF